MEQYLWCFVNYLQDDWNSWLPLSEFAANNQASESTGVSPFFANYSYDPRWQFDLRQEEQSPLIPAETDAHEMARQVKEIQEHLQAEILRAQHRYSEGADQRQTPARAFKEGDQEWLNTENIVTRRPSRKLDHRQIGPYKIVKVVSPWAYKLEMSDKVQIHPVQHVSYIHPVDKNPLPGQRTPPPLPVHVDGEDEWYVYEILDSWMHRRRLEYFVKCTGY
jgi:hypothetical protein